MKNSLQKGIEEIDFSKLKKNILVKRYSSFADYCWSIPPNMNSLLKRKARTLREVDIYMSKFCAENDMLNLFSDLKTKKGRVDLNDIDEAIYCYNSNNFKACVLLLFSIIDGIFIRLQKRGGYRTVNGGNEQLRKYFVDKDTYHLFIYLHAKNVCRCVEKMYQTPKDFRKIFKRINRDTVSHGMLARKVTQLDCKKTFLLVYNVIELLDNYNIKGKITKQQLV